MFMALYGAFTGSGQRDSPATPLLPLAPLAAPGRPRPHHLAGDSPEIRRSTSNPGLVLHRRISGEERLSAFLFVALIGVLFGVVLLLVGRYLRPSTGKVST